MGMLPLTLMKLDLHDLPPLNWVVGWRPAGEYNQELEAFGLRMVAVRRQKLQEASTA